jgi:hypothetical protein
MRLTKIVHYYESSTTYKRVEISDGEFNWLKWEWNEEYDGRWKLVLDEEKISKLESKHQEENPK